MAYVEFQQDWGSWKKGQISDEISDGVAAVLIKEGQARASDAMSYVRHSNASELAKLREELTTTVKSALQESRNLPANGVKPTPPNGGGGIDFNKIEHSRSPVDDELERNRKQGGFSRALRLIGIVGKPHEHDPGFVQHAHRSLMQMSDGATEYHFDDNTGTFTETSKRVLAGGGVETITRTGTDSLSGGTTYGFALKPEYLGSLFEISMEQQVFVNAAQNIPVSQGNEVKWPAWDQYQTPTTTSQGVQQSAVFAGINLYYEGESAARVSSDALLNMINFKIVDLTGLTALSRDFVKDNNLAFDAALTRMFGRAIGWMEDYMSLQGPGNGKPQGVFGGPSTLIKVRTALNKIYPADLTGMIASVSPMVWDDLRWITNITTLPQLSILSDGTLYVFQPNALISQAMKLSAMDKSVGGRGAELMHRPMGDLLGFPVYFSEKVPALGQTGDLCLVAPSQFGVARRAGLEMGVSEHFYFTTDLIAYRFKLRHDMKPLWRAPYLQADGSSTKVAPFVLLGYHS